MHVPELDRKAQEQMLIGNDLQDAVRRHEFELFYQLQGGARLSTAYRA